MSILAYSELVKEVFGISPQVVKRDLATLMNVKLTEEKVQVIRQLAREKRSSVSALLRKTNRNNTGGSYIATKKFLNELARIGLLERDFVGRRTYYEFPENSDLQVWLRD